MPSPVEGELWQRKSRVRLMYEYAPFGLRGIQRDRPLTYTSPSEDRQRSTADVGSSMALGLATNVTVLPTRSDVLVIGAPEAPIDDALAEAADAI